ncbi:NADH-quinone oxidoreductase subunit NuoE family protein [Desulforhopalus singaporensis]|uniref:NADH-quinone oxidoreductase subunit E n=1 Tax=Desulforhopalus singaporensis TaxID=91360 RepID=A0A1H0T637_9BACT|nr:NAD(P)H-dependent oxidoreductase subunit E [Desulforhopalus singaporensis]SDP49507.1 NADH-quinone oxidoreductase subunit E [Desulforhopalus singaporensis]
MELLDPAKQKRVFPDEMYEKLNGFVDDLDIDPADPRKKGNLIQVLRKGQQIFGYLPRELQEYVAVRLGIHHAEVSGVVSFYNFFTTTPKGEFTISVCMGTACYVNGADKILSQFERILGIKSGEVTEDRKFSIDSLRCVGACSLAPVVTINDKVYGRVAPQDVEKIIEDCLVQEEA